MDQTRPIFVPGVGQYDNLGDIILRRELIAWLRPLGRLHVYVGPSPAGYAESLGIGPDDVVYRSFSAWYRAALAEAWAHRAHYAFKPGEIQLTLVGMKEHVSMLPLLLVVRARGGRVARVGSGARNFAPLPRLLILPSIALSHLTVWRDRRTAEYLGRGTVMPDLAFAGGSAAPELGGPDRDVVVVSMRGDRPEPTAEWVDGVRAYAARAGHRLVVATQVLSDRERSGSLASRLGAELLDWDGTDHGEQEERLRALYRRTSLAVSDRLHVLITAVTEGALPLALLVDGSEKIDRHFAAAGMPGVAVRTGGLTADEVADSMAAAAGRAAERTAELAAARSALAAVREDLEALLAPANSGGSGSGRGGSGLAGSEPSLEPVGGRA